MIIEYLSELSKNSKKKKKKRFHPVKGDFGS